MKLFTFLVILAVVFSPMVFASTQTGQEQGQNLISTLLWIAVILFLAKIASLVEKIGQPSVLGELVIGVVLGNLALFGFNFFEPIKSNQFLPFLAELGVIILLFQVGLESNINQMKKVGLRAFLVATVGVVCPFVLGVYIVGPWLFPGLSGNAYLFLGAALTATSVGITARVFKDLNKLKIPEAQIVLGAAVIDDVMGLVILAVVSAVATVGAISLAGVGFIFFKAIAFLVASILLGQMLAPLFGKLLSKIHTGTGMKFTLAICFALMFSYFAGTMGLAPIVGAFAAGLVLDPVHFKYFKKPKVAEDLLKKAEDMNDSEKVGMKELADHFSEKHVEDLIEPVAHFLVPIFFIMTGVTVQLETLLNPKVLIVALGITVVAIVGKYVSGLFAGKVNKHIVGIGMVPRGEVGLIFASVGSSLGVISHEIFSIIVIMVILTTLLTPPILAHLLRKLEN